MPAAAAIQAAQPLRASPSCILFAAVYPMPSPANLPEIWESMTRADRQAAMSAILPYIAACHRAKIRPVDPEKYLRWRLWRAFPPETPAAGDAP